jgi:hypothetical protein
MYSTSTRVGVWVRELENPVTSYTVLLIRLNLDNL